MLNLRSIFSNFSFGFEATHFSYLREIQEMCYLLIICSISVAKYHVNIVTCTILYSDLLTVCSYWWIGPEEKI